jgi:hypothetical protein
VMIVRVRSVQRCVPCPREMRRVTIARRAILNAGDDLQQVRGALLAECAYWLVTCEIVTSGPRSPRVAAVPPRLVPRAPVPGRRKFLRTRISSRWTLWST